eukprot:944995-Prymnesium_polylepis.1
MGVCDSHSACACLSCETFYGAPLAHTSLRIKVCTTHTLTQHTHIHTLVSGHVSACPDGGLSILRTDVRIVFDNDKRGRVGALRGRHTATTY